MSAANCEETPRQKMIGVMYLVLTAMLALNVSSSVLDAFTKVQAGLTQTVSNYYKKNKQVYAEFDHAYALNESKVGPWRNKALKVKAKSDDIYNFIEELKWEIVRKADGEDADINNIVSKDNLDIAGEVMITFGKGEDLKVQLDSFREYLLGVICDKDPVLCNTIKVNLNTDNPPIVDGEIQTWASSNFEHLPLAAVITIMTKLQSDVRNAESDVITHLFNNIDAGSFTFNSISAHVLPESRYILKGGLYKARILLAAMDTTQRPEVVVNGRSVNKHIGDATVYEAKCNTVGVHKWKGVVKYVLPSGKTNEYTVEDEYIVAEPSVVVSPMKMNVFYVGVENPIRISVPGIAAENLRHSITNGKIVEKDGEFVVFPKAPGKSCDITVGIKGGQDLQTLRFRVKTVPNPVAKISGKIGGVITKSLLMASWGIKAELEDFDFNMQFKVVGFNLFVTQDGYTKESSSDGARFTSGQKKIIKKLRRGQRLGIDNIRAKGPDGKIRKLQSLSFKID